MERFNKKAVEAARKEIAGYLAAMGVDLTYPSTTLLVRHRYYRKCLYLLQPWRGESRRKYLAKRRRS